MLTEIQDEVKQPRKPAQRHLRRMIPVLVIALLAAAVIQIGADNGSAATWQTALPGEGDLEIADVNEHYTLVQTEQGFVALHSVDGEVALRFGTPAGERLNDLALAGNRFFVILGSESSGLRMGALGADPQGDVQWRWVEPVPAGTELIATNGHTGALWNRQTRRLARLNMASGTEIGAVEDLATVTTPPDGADLRAWTSPQVVAYRAPSDDAWSVIGLGDDEPIVDGTTDSLIPNKDHTILQVIQGAVYTLDETSCELRLFGQDGSGEWTGHDVDWSRATRPKACSPVGLATDEFLYLSGSGADGQETLWAVDTAAAQSPRRTGAPGRVTAADLDVSTAPVDIDELSRWYPARIGDRICLIDGVTGEIKWGSGQPSNGYVEAGHNAVVLTRQAGWWERVAEGNGSIAYHLRLPNGRHTATTYSDHAEPVDSFIGYDSATLILGDTVHRLG